MFEPFLTNELKQERRLLGGDEKVARSEYFYFGHTNARLPFNLLTCQVVSPTLLLLIFENKTANSVCSFVAKNDVHKKSYSKRKSGD